MRGTSTVLLLVLVAVLAVAAAGNSAYSLSGTPSIETPTRSVSYQGQQYTIDAVSRISATGSVTITTDVPEGAAYELNLRGPDNQLVSSERLVDDANYTFSYFGFGEAGTYAVTIQDGGDTVAAYPVVIAGYDLSITSPGRVEEDDEVTLEATVEERAVDRHSSLDSVQVIVGNDDVERQRVMSPTTGDAYAATISTAGLDPGTYNVYVVARGNATVRQRAEILGVSDTVRMAVGDRETTAQPTDTAAMPSTDSPPMPVTDSTSVPLTDTATARSTDSTPVPATHVDATPDTATDTRPSPATDTESGSAPKSVITPSTPASRTTSQSGAGFTATAAFAALLVVGLYCRR